MEAAMMLADYAMVHQNKLFITGAGINLMMVPPAEPYLLNFGVGLLVTVPWTATNAEHRLRLALVDDDERAIPLARPPQGIDVPAQDEGAIVGTFNVVRSPGMQVGEDSVMPVAFQFPGLQIPGPGSYKLTLQIDGTPLAAARFRVTTPSPPSPGTGSGPSALPFR